MKPRSLCRLAVFVPKHLRDGLQAEARRRRCSLRTLTRRIIEQGVRP